MTQDKYVWYIPHTKNGKIEHKEVSLDELKRKLGIGSDFALRTYLTMNKIGKSPEEYRHLEEMKKIAEDSKKHPLYYF